MHCISSELWSNVEVLHTGLPAGAGHLSPLKDPFWLRFRSEWAPLGGPGDRNFDAGPSRDLTFDPLSWFEPPSSGVKKTSKCEHSKNRINHAVDRAKKTCCLIHFVSRICFSPKEKCTSQKFMFFEILGSVIFASCFLPSAAKSLRRTKKLRGIEIRFLGPLGPL